MGEANTASEIPLSKKELMGGIALALYWGCVLMEAGEDAAAVSYGIPWLSVAGFAGLFMALGLLGAIPHLAALRPGGIIVRIVIFLGPIACIAASFMPATPDDASLIAFSVVSRTLMGISLGFMLGHLGSFLAHYPKTQAAIISVSAFLLGAIIYVACSGLLIEYGRLAVASLALVAGSAFAMVRFDERGYVVALSTTRRVGHEKESNGLRLPTGFWPLFIALLFYSMVYGLAVPLTLDVGAGTAHDTPIELVLLVPGVISLFVIIRFRDSFDFRHFQWFLFAPSVIALLVIPFADKPIALGCCALLILVFSFFDLASFILLVDLARNRDATLTMRIFAWGRMANFAGMALGWTVSAFILGNTFDRSGQPVTTCAFIGVAILVLLMTFFGNASFGPTDAVAANEESTSFDERCDAIAAKGKLSAREVELFKLLARGRSASYIAETLYLSPSTVKTHTYRIYRKLDIHSRQELIDLVESQRDEEA